MLQADEEPATTTIVKSEAKGGQQQQQQALLTPYQLGPFHLSHRIVHAPLTRCRAYGGVPQPQLAVYYAQRSTPGGLLIAEATHVMEAESQYPDTPGIYTQEQIDAWKPVVKAVHEKGAIFFCQIWHSGRSVLPEQMLVDKFRVAASNAISAGFDGVEVHGAHGYLVGHVLVMDRNDTGITAEVAHNECSDELEIVKAVCDEIGSNRVGFRCSPYTTYLGAKDGEQVNLGIHMARFLSDQNILFAHFVESRGKIAAGFSDARVSLDPFRDAFKGSFIAAGGYGREDGNAAIESGRADLIAYGRLFLSNPDLPKRFELRAPLNKYDRGTFYTNDRIVGYTDYPSLGEPETNHSD